MLAKWAIPWPPADWRKRLIYGEGGPDHECVCRTCGRQIGRLREVWPAP